MWLTSAEGGVRWPWAQRMARTFALDVDKCPKCEGRMKLVALVQDPKRSPASCDTSASRASPRPRPRQSAARLPDRGPAATHPRRPRGLITPPTPACAREAKFGRNRAECGRHGAQFEPHPKTFRRVREEFSTRPRLDKPRLFRLRSSPVEWTRAP